MSDLDKLIAAVEAGNTDRMMMLLHAVPARQWQQSRDAYHGSLDAAKALHDALLPGWSWQHGLAVGGRGSYAATVWLAHENDSLWKVNFAVSSNPARAWLIAILKAYQTKVNQ